MSALRASDWRRGLAVLLTIFSLTLVPLAAQALVEAYRFDDPAKEDLYKKLIAELRCLVCQNQNLADSNAELAVDLRRKTYEMVREGQSEEQILTYMVQRYGDFVLYSPRMKSTTMLLWLGPFIILAVAVIMLVRAILGRRKEAAGAPILDEGQRERMEKLLRDDAGDDSKNDSEDNPS